MSVVAAIAYLMISGGVVLTLVRLTQGPSLADRIVATDLLLVLLTCGAGIYAFDTGDGTYLIVMVVVGVLGFLGTVTVARFIEKRGA